MRGVRIVVAGLCAAALAGCGSARPIVPSAQSYYLSLGDSLAQGVQADPFGHVGDTDRGYADQLYDMIRRRYRDLGLVKLGCPGETTRSMIRAGTARIRPGRSSPRPSRSCATTAGTSRW